MLNYDSFFFLSEKRDSFTCLCKSRRTGHIISTTNLDLDLYIPALLCLLTQLLIFLPKVFFAIVTWKACVF